MQSQDEQIQQLKDEISILKGGKARPKFKPSKLDKKASEQSEGRDSASDPKKRPGSNKRSKTAEQMIHEEKIIASDEVVPVGSRLKGYRHFVVQDMLIQAHNVRYRLECWQTPEGKS